MELDLITGNLVARVLDHTQDMKQRGKKDLDVKNRSTQLSALHLASAANGNHDKDKEITHSACFPMYVTKEISNKGNPTHASRTPRPPPGLHLDNDLGYAASPNRFLVPYTSFFFNNN